MNRILLTKQQVHPMARMFRFEGVVPILQYLPNVSRETPGSWIKQLEALKEFPNHHHIVRSNGVNHSLRTVSELARVAKKNRCGLMFEQPDIPFERHLTQTLLQNPLYPVYKTYHMSNKHALNRLQWDAEFFPSAGVPLNVRICDEFTNFESSDTIQDRYSNAIRVVMENIDSFQTVVFSTHNLELFDKIVNHKHDSLYHLSHFGSHIAFRNRGSIQRMVALSFEDTDHSKDPDSLYLSTNRRCALYHGSMKCEQLII